MEKIETNKSSHKPKPLRMTSIEENVQLSRIQQTAVTTTSAIYERKPNQKALKVLTVAAYILFVSMAAITLSFYYVFLWVPTTNVMPPKNNLTCASENRFIIAENVTIRLENSTQLLIDREFFNYLYEQYLRQQSQRGKLNGTIEFTESPRVISSEARQRMEPLPLARLSSSTGGSNNHILQPSIPAVAAAVVTTTSTSSSSAINGVESRQQQTASSLSIHNRQRVDEDAEDAGEDDDADDEPFEASGGSLHQHQISIATNSLLHLNETAANGRSESSHLVDNDDEDDDGDGDDDDDDDLDGHHSSNASSSSLASGL